MDSKNVIAAISLSAAVIILYSLFFAPTQEQLQQNKIKQDSIEKNSDTPSIDQNENFTKLTREESLKETFLNKKGFKVNPSLENPPNI